MKRHTFTLLLLFVTVLLAACSGLLCAPPADPADEVTNRIGDETLADVRTDLHDRLLAWMERRVDPLRGEGWYARGWRGDHHIDPHLGEGRLA